MEEEEEGEEEEEKLNKDLSLDPQKNNHLHHHYHQQFNNHHTNLSRDVDTAFHNPFSPDSYNALLQHQHQQLYSQSQLESQVQILAAEPPAAPPKKRTRAGRVGGVGEIVEVQGGHILRATGRKDRHSKVCTAKGPRDRRVRLAAHTAIQFYDVQDRLGYDRPSKAVDWLMNKAKAAIDELAELPAWKPSAGVEKVEEEDKQGLYNHNVDGILPPSLDSDSIADTIKSFFPLGGGGGGGNGNANSDSTTQFHPYSRRAEIASRQDLKLSLQSFQDPMMIRFDNNSSSSNNNQYQFMQDQQQQQLLFGGGNGGLAGQATAHLFHQRGPLQSSNTPPVRAWIGDYSIASSSSSGQEFHPVSLSGIGYAGGFSGFCIPAHIQGGDQEEHDGIHNKPSSASSGSRH